jgi:hypothetical protein
MVMNPAADLIKNNPKLQFLQNRFNLTVLLAVEKAALHVKNPQQYPLPAAGKKTVERAMVNVVKALPERKQEKFLKKLKPALEASAAQRRQKYGDLAAVNLKSNKPLAEQVRDMPVADNMKMTETELEGYYSQVFPGKRFPRNKPAAKKPVPRQAAVATKLDFIVNSLTCTTTNDVRKDEISLGAFATDALGNESEKAPFFISKFKKGETVSLGANANLFSFSIKDGSVGGEFPQTFVAGLFLVEADIIQNVKLGEALTILFSSLAPLLMAITVALIFIPGVNIAAAVLLSFITVIVGILGHYILPMMIDDFSVAVTDTLVLEAPPAIGETFVRSLPLKIERTIVGELGSNRGVYTANARWVVS